MDVTLKTLRIITNRSLYYFNPEWYTGYINGIELFNSNNTLVHYNRFSELKQRLEKEDIVKNT